MKKEFTHKDYKEFAGKYLVQTNGRIFSKGKEVRYFRKLAGGKFIRLFKNGKNTSMTVAKIVMLVFKPNGYDANKIVLHINGDNSNDAVNNLKWGNRKEQSSIHMSNPKNWLRISKMGKKYGHKNGKRIGHIGANNLATWRLNQGLVGHSKKTVDKIQNLFMEGKTPSEIARKLNISRSSIYNHI